MTDIVEVGVAGPQGPQGLQGTQGTTGLTGPQGPQGPPDTGAVAAHAAVTTSVHGIADTSHLALVNNTPQVFSPMAYGAVGDGIANDTTALQNCAAAAAAAGGIMDLGTRTFNTTSAIPITPNFHLKGAGSAGTISNAASDIFTVAGVVGSVTVEDCALVASGGHVFNAGTANMTRWSILNVAITQGNPSYSIWHQTGGGWLDCQVDRNCFFLARYNATVSPWNMTGIEGTLNSIVFRKMRCTLGGGTAPVTVPFFNIDPGVAVGWNEDITFDSITWEVCAGGAIWMTACRDVTINKCSYWDATPTANTYNFSTSTAGYSCRNITIRGGRSGGATGAVYDVYADANSTNILIESFGMWGTSPTISSPPKQTTIINGAVSGSSTTGLTVPATILPQGVPVALADASDGTHITPNAIEGRLFRVTPLYSRTMNAPFNPTDGQIITFEIIQPAAGNRTITWDAVYVFGPSGAPVLSTAGNAHDFLTFQYNAALSQWVYQSGSKDISTAETFATSAVATHAAVTTSVHGIANTSKLLTSASGATGARPNAVTAGAGAIFFDTSLTKPIWSDGSVWRDATGTAV